MAEHNALSKIDNDKGSRAPLRSEVEARPRARSQDGFGLSRQAWAGNCLLRRRREGRREGRERVAIAVSHTTARRIKKLGYKVGFADGLCGRCRVGSIANGLESRDKWQGRGPEAGGSGIGVRRSVEKVSCRELAQRARRACGESQMSAMQQQFLDVSEQLSERRRKEMLHSRSDGRRGVVLYEDVVE